MNADGKIRVLFFQSQEYFGADSRVHALLMRYLDREQVEVHVACNRGSGGKRPAALTALDEVPNLHVVPASFGPTVNAQSLFDVIIQTPRIISAIGSMAHVAWYARRHGIDVIHGTEKPRDALYGTVMSRLVGARSVIHLHVKYATWISPLVRKAMHVCDAIVGVSRFVAETTVAGGYDPQRTHYVLNSIDPNDWDFSMSGDGVRREFGIPADAPLLAVVSRLFSWKGHSELLKALAIVHQRDPAVRLLVVGDEDPRAHPGGGSYRAELRTLLDEHGMEDRVIFTGFRSDVQAVMAACDIYTMPSFEEPFGIVFLEAMAMKKPVVALNNGGTPEVVEDGKSGLLSQPGDIEALAANILRLVEDPELRRRMGEYGRSRVEEHFNPLRMADDMLQIYKHVLRVPA